MDDARFPGQDVPHNPDRTPQARTPWNTVDGRVISLVSRKGGVGKTTSAVNLGAALALSGHTVLIVGTDPQCGVCRTLGTAPLELPGSLNDIFGSGPDEPGVSLTDLALTSPLDNLYFVSPRIITLADEETYLNNLAAKAEIFVQEIDSARHLYDTILIDCPPNLGAATRAALLASDSYLVPVQAEELCRDSVASLLEFVDAFSGKSQTPAGPGSRVAVPGSGLPLEGLFLTMASERTRMGRHVAARVSEDFGDLLFSVGVPRTTRLSEMALRGKPAVIYDRRSAGSRAYFDLADELVNRYSSGTGSSPSLIDDMIASMSRTLAREEPVWSTATPDVVGEEPGNRNAEAATPEMVSLDDLLAEEEHRGGRVDGRIGTGDDDWEDGYWSGDPDRRDRMN